jgi:hypothetical protein
MKKSVALALLLSVVLSLNSSVSAKSDSTFNLRIEKAPAEATVSEERQVRVTQRVEKFQERRSAVAENHAKRLASHFAGYYNRLNNLITKIQVKITEVKTTGKNTNDAQTKLDAAKASLESAKVLGEQAVAAFQAIDPYRYSEQRDEALAARDLAQKAREAFLTALKNLKVAVEALKALRTEE